MSDPMMKALVQLGVDTEWEVDVVQTRDGRLVVVVDDTNMAVGEIQPDGLRVMFQDPVPFDPYEDEGAD